MFASRSILVLAIALVAAVPPGRQAWAEPSADARATGDAVLAAVVSDDADLRGVALDRIRHGLAGGWFTQAVAAKLPSLPVDRQAAVVAALGDRGDAAALPAVNGLLGSSPDAGVRAAALRAIGALGGGGDVAALTAALGAGDPQRAAAVRGLQLLRGDDAAAAIRAAAQGATGGTRATLLDVLAARRDRGALADMVAATADADPAVRQAGARGVASLGGPAEVEGLMKSVLRATPGSDRDEVEKALIAVCTVNAGREQAAEAFMAGFRSAGEADRESLLPGLGRIGGPAALAVVDGLLADPASRELGLTALTRWPDATVKDRLLELVGATADDAERNRLLGALIRIAPLPDNKLNDAQKLELLEKTMTLCQKTEDKARVLERANAIRTIETFRFVVPYLDDPALAEPACRSVVELAHHQKLRDAHKEEFQKALDKVLGTTKNEELVERAKRYKAGQTWDRSKKS